MAEDDDAVFSRRNSSGDELAELRINIPRKTLAVFDAIASFESKQMGGKGVSRTDVVNRILNSAALDEINKASLIHQVAEINPTVLAALDRREK